MELLISFIVLTFVLMLAMHVMYNSRSVYVICDVVPNDAGETIHIISGVMTDKNIVKKHFDPTTMYVLEIPLNKFKKLTTDDIDKMSKAKLQQEKDNEEFMEVLDNFIKEFKEQKSKDTEEEKKE